MELFERIWKHKDSEPFKKKIEDEAYLKVISTPMDLQKIKRKIK